MDHSSDIFVFVWIHLTDYWNGMTMQMFLLRIQGVHVHALASVCGGLRFRHKRLWYTLEPQITNLSSVGHITTEYKMLNIRPFPMVMRNASSLIPPPESTPLSLFVYCFSRRIVTDLMQTGIDFIHPVCSLVTPGASERFRKWGYKFVRTLYNLVVKVVCLKFWHKQHLSLGGYRGYKSWTWGYNVPPVPIVPTPLCDATETLSGVKNACAGPDRKLVRAHLFPV